MYAYFYIDKDDNLVECDRDTYKEWAFSFTANLDLLKEPWDTFFFYIKNRKVCVECPVTVGYAETELYERLEDKYGDGNLESNVMYSEFSVKNKDYTISTDICDVSCVEDDDDSDRGFYGYYPTFSTNVQCSSNGNYAGEAGKLIDCPNYGLEKAIEYHESIILDIVSGKDLKYIS